MVLPSSLIFSLYRAKGLGDRARDLWRDFDPNKTPRMLLPTLLVSLSPHGMAWHFFLRVVSTWATFSPTHPAAPRRGFSKRLQRGPHTGRGAKPVGWSTTGPAESISNLKYQIATGPAPIFLLLSSSMPPSLIAFILIFLTGALLRSFNILDKSHAERLATIVFSLSLPATILVSLDQVSFAPTAWKLPMAAALVTLPLVFVAFHLSRLLRLSRPSQGGFLISIGCINSIYFAYPVILATLGDAGLVQAILFDLGQTTLTLTLLYGLAVWHGAQASQTQSAFSRFFSSPPLWALLCILALKFIDFRLPAWLRDLLLPLHLTTTPLASLVLGLSINFAAVRCTLRLALLGVILRMGGGLLLGFAGAYVLSLTGVERAVVILVAGMPSAVTAVIFAAETGLDEDLVASIVALSICVGVAQLPWLPQVATML
jgi:malate permease and related proteins